DPVRRHYYDSSANEAIGFYAEEMLLHAGLFDDSPRSREFIWTCMRLRALRLEVDVRLALGMFSLHQAAKYLRGTVPMDSATANQPDPHKKQMFLVFQIASGLNGLI